MNRNYGLGLALPLMLALGTLGAPAQAQEADDTLVSRVYSEKEILKARTSASKQRSTNPELRKMISEYAKENKISSSSLKNVDAFFIGNTGWVGSADTKVSEVRELSAGESARRVFIKTEQEQKAAGAQTRGPLGKKSYFIYTKINGVTHGGAKWYYYKQQLSEKKSNPDRNKKDYIAYGASMSAWPVPKNDDYSIASMALQSWAKDSTEQAKILDATNEAPSSTQDGRCGSTYNWGISAGAPEGVAGASFGGSVTFCDSVDPIWRTANYGDFGVTWTHGDPGADTPGYKDRTVAMAYSNILHVKQKAKPIMTDWVGFTIVRDDWVKNPSFVCAGVSTYTPTSQCLWTE